MYTTIRYEREGGIGIVTINRPEVLNALNSTVIEELQQLVFEMEKDSALRAVIFTGEGRSFVAGADIAEQCPLDLAGGRAWGRRGSALFRRIEQLEIPTIAAVNGFALGGGCELAMGVMADKDYPRMIQRLLPFAAGWIAVTPENGRALPSAQLCAAVKELFPGPVFDAGDVREGLSLALERSGAEGAVCAFGSLYMVSKSAFFPISTIPKLQVTLFSRTRICSRICSRILSVMFLA